jgi:diguanylate cyclase (GGDEF)-like protein/PAS domain S-box-containing protein
LIQDGGVPIIVIAKRPDYVEAVNSTLRKGGHPVHCTWISDLGDLPDALVQINPELVLAFTQEIGAPIRKLVDIRNQLAPTVPVLEVRDSVDEELIARAMSSGAQDAVSLKHRSRLNAVCTRELRSFRLERALDSTLAAATEYKHQLKHLLEDAADAIAHVHDGIIVATNPAWLQLFGYPDPDELVGMPVMDFFDKANHLALKSALVASGQGKWHGHELKAQGRLSDDSTLPVVLQLVDTEFEGEPCVRLCIPARTAMKNEPEAKLERFAKLDATTALYNRRHFLEQLSQRLKSPEKGGVRALLYITLDGFRDIKADVGPLASEDVLVEFAKVLRDITINEDLYGRFGGTMFLVFVSRGTMRDVESWAESLCARIRGKVFEAGRRSVSLSCSVGIAAVDGQSDSLEELVRHADKANEQSREAGGDQLQVFQMELGEDTQAIRFDTHWIKEVKSALKDNRFSLLNQPIASLTDDDKDMYDVVLRMQDSSGQVVLPSHFIPAAERNGLMKPIDRWVLGAAVRFCSVRHASRVFARISVDSVVDPTLVAWVSARLKEANLVPSALCIQVTEEAARKHLKQAQALASQLADAGIFFALEHFGLGNKSVALLGKLKLDYVKIDGSLMQGLATSEANQSRIRSLVEAARSHRIDTIAERVEDANTMAVLWQLGVQYMQGYFVQEPEVVLQDVGM